jgi:hypothetical protein
LKFSTNSFFAVTFCAIATGAVTAATLATANALNRPSPRAGKLLRMVLPNVCISNLHLWSFISI